ncbi:MAG: hypothetical protein JWQ22_1355 [Devosia sp.]|nr:hypothetical protein [Devosia sp.]
MAVIEQIGKHKITLFGTTFLYTDERVNASSV